MKDRIDPMNERLLQDLHRMAQTSFRNDSRRLATCDQWFRHHITQQRLIETGSLAPPAGPVTLKFQRTPEGWLLGFASAPHTCTYPHAQDALVLAHAAFSRPWTDIDIFEILPHRRGGLAVVGNALRNARRRLASWIELHVDCKPLAPAVRAVKISNEGYVRFDPDGRSPRIET
jgi:hypothetical protein